MLCPRCNVANGEGEERCRNCRQRLTCVACSGRMTENDVDHQLCDLCRLREGLR
jgi:primosomal protein N'